MVNMQKRADISPHHKLYRMAGYTKHSILYKKVSHRFIHKAKTT